MTKQILTQARLKELFEYSKEDGILTRKTSIGGRVAGSIAGYLDKTEGYLCISIDSKTYKLHRIVFFYVIGRFPKNEIDHINGNKSDNRWINLRDVSKSDNQKNASKRKDNKSGCTGVSWHNRERKWVVRIQSNKQYIEIGSFNDMQDAITARKEAELKYGFHPNHGR